VNDRVATVAKFISEFDGTLESADRILDETSKIRGVVRQEITALMKELNAIDGFIDYILTKRNELAHDEKPHRKTEFVMTNKKERVEAVIDAVMNVVEEGVPLFSIGDIIRKLERMNIDLGVSYPPAVIATILTADKRFKKTNTGLYEYIMKEKGENPKGRRKK